MRLISIDPGQHAGFALIDSASFVPGEFRGSLPRAQVVEATTDLAVAGKWKAEVVVCEGQYPCEDVSAQSLLTLAYCAGMLLGTLFATSGAKKGYVLKPRIWKEALAAGSARIRKDIVLNRISRALLPSELTTDRDILDAIGIGWGFCALGVHVEEHLKIQRGVKFRKSSKIKSL